MPRATRNPPPAEPPRGPDPADVPTYRYDPNLGNPRDTYTRADLTHRDARRPEVAGTFVAVVEGQTVINTMWGRRIVKWRAEPGTRCVILGYWSDGTVHLRWPAMGAYRVDGRFPAWVVAEDKTLSDIFLGAFMARRSILIGVGTGLKLIGSRFSPDTRRLREYLARNRMPHQWIDLEEDENAEALEGISGA